MGELGGEDGAVLIALGLVERCEDRVTSGGAFFSAELLNRIRQAGRSIAEVGVPHYPRTAGSPTGAKPSVIWRAVKDFWGLRLRLWASRERALGRGSTIIG